MRHFVESYGCTMNRGEGDRLSRILSSMGHAEASSAEDAELIVLNTCTVVDTTEKRMVKRMAELRRAGKQVVVTGCMAKAQPNRVAVRLPGSEIIAPEDYGSFRCRMAERYGDCGPAAVRPFGPTETIPIASGCLGACTYCITRLARGRLRSRDPEDIASVFGEMVESGTEEVMLAGQDTACYGLDIGTDLPSLVRRLLEAPGDYRIRIGMMNPDRLEPVLDGMIDVLRDPRVYTFLHIPVQSGSDRVLERMGRRYTADSFLDMIRRLREELPDISIATDVISGFPGETEEDHRMTLALLEELQADTVNITRFSARPGTPAASFGDRVPGNVSKDRSAELTEMKSAICLRRNEAMVGHCGSVLVTEHGTPGTVIARTDSYRPVGIEGDHPIGTRLNIEVDGARPTHLIGRPVM